MFSAFQVGGSSPIQFAFEVRISSDHAGCDESPSWADDAILEDPEAVPVPTDRAGSWVISRNSLMTATGGPDRSQFFTVRTVTPKNAAVFFGHW
jgi:hypothetical protein